MAGFGEQKGRKKKRPQQKSEIRGESLLKDAIQHHIRGNLVSAERGYREAIKVGYYNHAIFINLGVICKSRGQTEEAILLYKKAIEISPNDPDAYSNLGNLYQSLGNFESAAAFSIKSLDIKPVNPEALVTLGWCQKELGNLDQALASTLKSLELKPDHPTAHMNLGGIYKDLGNLDQALASTLKSLELKSDNPDAHMNLGGIYKDLGNLDQALASTLKSLELKSDNPTAHMNLGDIYKNLGNPDQALASTLKSLELKSDDPTAHMNLGGIYKDLGNLDQALASTLKSIELKPEGSQALCKLGLIKMVLGQTKEARRDLLISIERNNQECEAHYALSTMLETTEEAEEVIELMKSVKTSVLTPQTRAFAEFALSNCFHKIKNHDPASKHLRLANEYKLRAYASDADARLRKTALSISHFDPTQTTNINTSGGEERIFIVGMPRSGSTLLETILSMNPEIKDLGESRSLEKAIAKIQQQEKTNSFPQDLNEAYSQMEPFDNSKYTYTTDKQLYNFEYINHIAAHMPAAKIIHCRRNPMDNVLSMFRSNLSAGNNYTASLEDSAKVLIVQEQVMQIHKKRHPEKIFTFDYDQFVNKPETNLRKLLGWLDLEFNESYLHPEKSTRSVNTASVMQARKPISNKSVGGWKNYESLLKPALKIIQESGIEI